MNDYPQTISGKCSNCGSADLMLAQDFTDFSPCKWNPDTQTWKPCYTDAQSFDAPDSVRFFCTNCGTQHALPMELTT